MGMRSGCWGLVRDVIRERYWEEIRRLVPWLMIAIRALGCALIIVGARRGWAGGWLGAIVVLALLSDIYDGILARLWGHETAQLRVSDSVADTIFYLGVLAALWLREPQVLRGNWQLLVGLLGLEAFRYVFDLWKFRRLASYHSYMAKAWGLLIAVAVVAVLSFGGLRLLISVALIFGIVVNLEGLAMSVMLPRWKNDVKTLWRAWDLRKAMLAEQTELR
jgi:phosphatidylglycerophosphate synthase